MSVALVLYDGTKASLPISVRDTETCQRTTGKGVKYNRCRTKDNVQGMTEALPDTDTQRHDLAFWATVESRTILLVSSIIKSRFCWLLTVVGEKAEFHRETYSDRTTCFLTNLSRLCVFH